MSDEVRINGVQHSWGSVKFKIDGEPYVGFTSIKYTDKLETQFSYGTGRHQGPRGQTRGKYICDPVELTMAKSSAEAVRAQLSKKSGKPAYGIVQFPMVLQFVEEGDVPMTVEFERCRYVGTGADHQEGGDPLNDDVTFSCALIRRNGRTLFDESEG